MEIECAGRPPHLARAKLGSGSLVSPRGSANRGLGAGGNPSTYLRHAECLGESSCTLPGLLRGYTTAATGDGTFGPLVLPSLQSGTRGRTKIGCGVPVRANGWSAAASEIFGAAHLFLPAMLGFTRDG